MITERIEVGLPCLTIKCNSQKCKKETLSKSVPLLGKQSSGWKRVDAHVFARV